MYVYADFNPNGEVPNTSATSLIERGSKDADVSAKLLPDTTNEPDSAPGVIVNVPNPTS